MDALPTELRQEILCWLCGTRVNDVRVDGEVATVLSATLARVPYELASVSRQWRQICLTTPELWSHIYLPLYLNQSDLDSLSCRLMRSGNHPLDIDVRSAEFMDWSNEPLHLAFLQLEKHTHRWRRCRFEFQLPHPASGFLSIMKTEMPLLEYLILIPRKGRQDRLFSANTLHPQQLNSTRLRHLESHVNVIVPTQPLPHLEYLSYSLRNIVDDPLWLTLPLTPALKELHLYFPRSRYMRQTCPPLQEEINLPFLVRLSVYGFPGDWGWPNRLRMPKVRALAINMETADCTSTLFAALSKQLDHLIITSIEPETYGWLSDVDCVAIDQMEVLHTLELRGFKPDHLSEDNQEFFEHLSGREHSQDFEAATVVDESAPGWAKGFDKLILRDCTLNLTGCRSLAKFVTLRQRSAINGQSVPLELLWNNTTILRDSRPNPAWFEASQDLFHGVQWERDFSDYAEWSEDSSGGADSGYEVVILDDRTDGST